LPKLQKWAKKWTLSFRGYYKTTNICNALAARKTLFL
jgi:hypothetical protein